MFVQTLVLWDVYVSQSDLRVLSETPQLFLLLLQGRRDSSLILQGLPFAQIHALQSVGVRFCEVEMHCHSQMLMLMTAW